MHVTYLCVYAGQTLLGPIYSIAVEVVTALYALTQQRENGPLPGKPCFYFNRVAEEVC